MCNNAKVSNVLHNPIYLICIRFSKYNAIIGLFTFLFQWNTALKIRLKHSKNIINNCYIAFKTQNILNIKTYFFILLIFIPVGIFSQDYSVKGKVYDVNNSPISFANIVLLNTETDAVVTGTSSDDSGNFFIDNIASEKYIIKVSFIGFKDFSKEIEVDKNLDFATIILEEDKEDLEEVTIITKKPTIKKEADRLVFNIANTALSEGNMLEVLKSTPGVLIVDESIIIKHFEPVVYINNRKVHITGDELIQLLEGTPASHIKSIEVITNPPANYDASSGSVLNIIMEKNLITGYKGSVFANYTQGDFPRYNAGIANFYKTDKFNISTNYSFTRSKIDRESDEEINYINNGEIYEKWFSNINRNRWSDSHNLNLNFDYFIDDSNTLSFNSNLLFLPYYKYIAKGEVDVTDNQNNLLYNFNSRNTSRDNKYNLAFDLNYTHKFKNASKLSFNSHYTAYDYDRKQEVLSNYFFPGSPNDSNAFHSKSNQVADIFTVQVDYSLPISETESFSVGVKTSLIENKSDISHFDEVGGNQTYNPANSDAFNYYEDIFAAYVSYAKNWGKWDLSAGFRLEQTNIEGDSPLTNLIDKQDYFKVFPTFNLSSKLTESTSLYVNYNRSVDRPKYQDLNSFKYFLNDNTVVVGNPNLQPAFIDKFVIGTSINDTYTIEAYYNHSIDNFLELPIQDNIDNQLVYTPVNIEKTIEFGFDFSTYFNVTNSWFVYFVTSFYNIQDQVHNADVQLKKDTWSNYSVLSNDFAFLKDRSLTANFTMVYIGKNQQGFQDVKTRLATDLAIKKTVLNNRGTISLSASDLFNTQGYSVTSRYLNQNNRRDFKEPNRYIKLGLSYKLGNSNLETNERIKELKERDRLEK